MNATFMQRLVAYIIDILIISFIVGLITIGFNNKNLESLSDDLNNTMNELTTVDENTNVDELTNKLLDLEYEIQKASIPNNVVTIIITFIYFIVFQYLNKGQTIGKKIMKIRIVDENNNNLSFIKMFLRCFIIVGFLSSAAALTLILFLKQDLYIECYYCINVLCYAFIFISAIMILYRNDKRGLHDMMVKSNVIYEKK